MDLDQLEQQRLDLERSLQELRSSLRHWHIWEAEYEGLKEELECLDATPKPAAIIDISKSYDGELVTEQEIRELAGLHQNAARSPQQIMGLITHRQDYVQKNIDTIQRRFWEAEAKLEEFDFAASSSFRRSASGSPLTEIQEELDDDDNIIASRTSQPEVSTARLVDAFRKAGLADSDISAPSSTDGKPAIAASAENEFDGSSVPDAETSAAQNAQDENALPRRPIRKKSVSFTADTKPAPEPARSSSEDSKRSVSFAPKVAVAPAALTPDSRSVSFSPTVEEIPANVSLVQSPAVTAQSEPVPPQAQTVSKLEPASASPHDEETTEALEFVLPEDEPEADARTRREMIDYHLHEVGNVVAQIDLDEGYSDGDEDGDDATTASDFTPSEHLDEDTPYTSGLSDTESDDEDEDEFGRTKKRVISDAYHQQMRELQQRLIGNLGPSPTSKDVSSVDPELDPRDVRRLVIRGKTDSTSDASPERESRPINKKRVSFAEALDISENGAQSMPIPKKSRQSDRTISAHNTSSQQSTSVDDDKKDDKSQDDDEDHTGPAGMVIADTLKERVTKPTYHAPSVDDPDPIMQRRQLAAEYYRRRNDIIRQQGGFSAGTDDDQIEELGELMEERDGKPKRVSRFKAARIRS